MHRLGEGLGDDAKFGIEQGTGEVGPGLDVGRVGRLSQGRPHLVGGGFEGAAHHFEPDGVHVQRRGRLLGPFDLAHTAVS